MVPTHAVVQMGSLAYLLLAKVDFNNVFCSIIYCIYHMLDINECTNDPEICGIHTECTNTNGSYACACRDGYNGTPPVCTGTPSIIFYVTANQSIDVNECNDDTNICGESASCANTDGSYICTCNRGYSGIYHLCIGWYIKFHLPVFNIFNIRYQ